MIPPPDSMLSSSTRSSFDQHETELSRHNSSRKASHQQPMSAGATRKDPSTTVIIGDYPLSLQSLLSSKTTTTTTTTYKNKMTTQGRRNYYCHKMPMPKLLPRPPKQYRRTQSLPAALIPNKSGKALFWFRPPTDCNGGRRHHPITGETRCTKSSLTDIPPELLTPDLRESSSSKDSSSDNWTVYLSDDDDDDDNNEDWSLSCALDEGEEEEELHGLCFLDGTENDREP